MSELILSKLVDDLANQSSTSAYMVLLDSLLFNWNTDGKPIYPGKERSEIIEKLHMYAKNGNAISMALLGALYLYGIDNLQRDTTKGIELAKRSASLGDSMGEVVLGLAYLIGTGVAKDEERAIYWFKMAEDKNNPHTLNNLGWMHEHGLENLKVDPTTAFRYYRSSAEQACSFGLYNVGRCYENGIGTSVDYPSAVEWYKKASEKGQPLAQIALAKLYEEGLGTEKNILEAIKWNLFASRLRRPELEQSEKAIDRLTSAGYGEQISKIKEEFQL